MKSRTLWLSPLLSLSLLALPGCGSDDADADTDGKAGSCTITDKGDGTSAIVCPDGTELVVSNGKDGAPGKDGDKGDQGDKGDKGDGAEAPCVLGENTEGKHTLTCGEETVVIGDDCEDGFYGDVFLYGRDDSGSNVFSLFQVTNCTWIRGDVEIVGFDGEALPKALSRIVKIDGSLEMYENDSVKEITLPALEEVSGDIIVEENPSLETAAFPSLRKVSGDLDFYDNDNLVEIGGFASLESIGGWLSAYEHERLERIGGFDALKSFGGIAIETNASLVSVADFPALETIEGFGDGPDADYALLYIVDNAALSSVGGLGTVSEIDGNVIVSTNPMLPQCEVDALLDTLTITGTTHSRDNDDTASCP